MKIQTKSWLKSLVSLVLCLSMVLCTPLMAFAAENDNTFNYVALGASNTNGYGMRGYITADELALLLSGQVNKNDVNVYGYQRKPEGSYPDLIRDYYEMIYGKNNVKLDQLGISSMRVEELRVLLDESYSGDEYTGWRFTGSSGWFNSAEPGGINALRAAYQENIAEADLITVDIGWNNFGVYICNQLVDYMSKGTFKWQTELEDIYVGDEDIEDLVAAAEESREVIKNYISNTIGEGAMTEALADIFAYSILGYMYHFDICMEKIYALNPDADVVVLGIQNLLYGVNIELNGQTIPLGNIFGNFVNMANYYSSTCSPYSNKYQYVKVGTDEHVTVFLDAMVDYNGDAKNLNLNIKDCFDYYDDNLYIQTRIDLVAAALIEDKYFKEYGDILIENGYTSGAQMVAAGKEGKLSKISVLFVTVNLQEEFDAIYWPALYAAYDTLATVVREIAITDSVDVSGLLSGNINIGNKEADLKKALEDEIMENAMAIANGENYTVDIDKILPDAATELVAAMYIRYYMGNSFFIHPNEEGHKEIKNAVIGIIESPETEKEQPLSDYLVESVKAIHNYMCGANGHEKLFGHRTESTCKNEGVEATYCSCGAEKEETIIDKKEHTYAEDIVPEWIWTEDYKATATFVCSVCDEPDVINANVSENKTEPDCKNEGKLVYTATVEFKGQTFTDSKDKVLEKIEHNYGEDGRCQNTLTNGTICGEYNLAQYGKCTPTVSAELVSGSTLTMLLDGNNVGEFTFTETESGWTIANAEGKYLASDANGNLVLSDSAYGWNYSDGKFSTTVKVPGTSWIEQLLGLTKDATYYLEYSEESVVVASSGSAVTFSTTKDNGYHTFGEINVVDPTCTEKGYTERTCSVCGEVFKTNEVDELGHSYVDTVVPPKCGVEGYTEHKCACGDSYTDTIVPAREHDFSGENDTCIHCGISNVAVYGECEFKTEASLSDGTYTLSLGGTDVGVYTFSAVSGGYTIKDSDGKYLSVDSNGNLVCSESEFTWTYSNGKFSASVGKASTNWLEALFGGNKKTTYYLAASGSDVTVSTTGAEAKFYIAGKAETHTFEEAYVEPECGVDGYTEFTCTVCGDKFTKEDEGSALEHDYVRTGTVEVTCLTDGYSVYTCSKCGDTYNDDFVTASGSHNFGEDGRCQNVLPNGVCGEPKEPEEPDCVYDKEQTLVSGNTYELTLGGKSVGEYTFNSVEGGWSIMNSDGKYLALEGGKLVVSDSAFAWTYSNGRFSSSSSSGTTGIEWLDAILGGKKSTYYLVSSGNTAAVSTSNSSASAKFIAKVTGEHNYSKAKPVNGNHVSVCSNCGYEKTEICNDDNCVLCNASVNVSVSVTKSEPTHWLEILLGGGSSSYKASITTVANGTEVDSVEYSLDGTTWTKGTSFTSKTEISSFSIRVNADNGLTYNYIYSNGSVEFVG